MKNTTHTHKIISHTIWIYTPNFNSQSGLNCGVRTSLKFCSNLNAPPPVAHTVVTNCAIPFDLANWRKLPISDVGNRMKCNEPRRPRIWTSSICTIWHGNKQKLSKASFFFFCFQNSRAIISPVNVCLDGRFCHMLNFLLNIVEYFAMFPPLDRVQRALYLLARNTPIWSAFHRYPCQTMALL